MTAFVMIFRRFPTTFRRFSENFPKLFGRPDERSRTFSENFRKFPKVSEDFRRLPKTFEEDPKMFRWYTNEFKYNLRDKLDVSEIIDIFTCEDIISSHVRLSISYHSLYHWLLYNNCFYYIKVSGIASGNKLIKTIRYPHMWRYDIFTCEDIGSWRMMFWPFN